MTRRDFVISCACAPLLASQPGAASSPQRKPFLVTTENSPAHEIGGGEARILVGSELSGGEWWLGSFRSDSGRLTSLHVHHSADEQFYTIEGVMSVWLDGKWRELPAGGFAAVPRGVPHALGNRSKASARYLVSGNPAGFEQFFTDIERAIRRLQYGSPEFFAEVARIYLKYDSKLLGPPPQ